MRVEGLEKGKGMGRRNRLVLTLLRCVGVHRAERGVLSNHRDGIPRKTIFGACPQFITWGPCGTIATWGLSAWVVAGVAGFGVVWAASAAAAARTRVSFRSIVYSRGSFTSSLGTERIIAVEQSGVALVSRRHGCAKLQTRMEARISFQIRKRNSNCFRQSGKII